MEFPWMGFFLGEIPKGSCGGFSEYFGRGAGADMGPCPRFFVFKVKIYMLFSCLP